jgi:hypothetical protein
MLGGETEHWNPDVRQIGALVERDEALHSGPIGRFGYGGILLDEQRAPGRIGIGPHHAVGSSSGILRHRATGLERREPVRHELLLEIAGRISERRRGARKHRRTICVRPVAQHRLHHHAAHRVADQHGPLEAGDACLDVFGESLEAHRLDRLASTIAHQVERDRLIAGRGEARHLRRERARAHADAVQENDRDHSGFPSRADAAGSPKVCISRFAQANIATA